MHGTIEQFAPNKSISTATLNAELCPYHFRININKQINKKVNKQIKN